MPEPSASRARKLTSRLSSWPTWVVLGVALTIALVIGSRAPGGGPSVGQRVAAIASDIRCPSCSGLSAQDSNASTAIAIRNSIRQRVEAGQTDSEIEAYLESRYGTSVLLSPPASGVDALVWVIPLAALGAALAILTCIFATRRKRRPLPASAADQALVEKALQERSGAEDEASPMSTGAV